MSRHPHAVRHVLDNPFWVALSGPHRRFAETSGAAARYREDIAPFAALADPADPAAWADLAALLGPGTETLLPGVQPPPAGWTVLESVAGVQLTGEALRSEAAPDAVRLGSDDVPEMLELIDLTRPGPFRPRTVELGTYLGVRHGGRLIAMAGERLRLPGWTEISAVCTHPDHRGGGLGTRLIRAVAAGISARGEVPFLHASAVNTAAIRLYESIGFTLRGRLAFSLLRSPDGRPEADEDRHAGHGVPA